MAKNRWTDEELRAAKTALAKAWLRPGVLRHGTALRVESAKVQASRNVHGVGIGRRETGGGEEGGGTGGGERCVRVHVVKKLPRSLVPERDLVPATIDGIPTDVVESAPAVLHPVATRRREARPGAGRDACTRMRKKSRRPVVPGVSVAHSSVTAGTIAAFVRSTRPQDDPDAIHVLSNNHVLADVDRGQPGDAILQPGPYDGGTASDRIADLARFVPLKMGGRAMNRVDAAIARLRDGIEWSPEVCTLGRVTEVVAARDGQVVRKHGRTTGVTEGVVTDVAYDVLVGMDDSDDAEALFVDQVRIARRAPHRAFGLGGDSGSLVVTADDAPRGVGLYFAGPDDGSYGICNLLADVLELLEIVLA